MNKPGHENWSIRWFETLPSTNRTALGLPAGEDCHRLVIAARRQTEGRGRQQRNWLSLKDKGVYASLILEKELEKLPPQLISMMMALAVRDAVAGQLANPDLPVTIKWPNDVLADGRKISGILGEMAALRGGKQRVVIGVSVNLLHERNDFPQELRDSAVSLAMLSGTDAVPGAESFLETLLVSFDAAISLMNERGPKALADRIERNSPMINGQRLKVQLDDGTAIACTSCGLNADGSLQIRLQSGLEQTLYAGDVHLL